METLAEFDKEIIYKPGKENVVADVFSRPPKDDDEEEINNLLEITSSLTKEVQEAYQHDEAAKVLIEYIKNPNPAMAPALQTKAGQFTLQNDILYFKERMFVPADNSLRLKILQEYHDAPAAGHLGIDKTYENLSRNFYWPRMSDSVKSFVTSCDYCQRNKTSQLAPAGLLQPLPIPTQNWQQISMDFITQLPKTKTTHKDAIVVFVDRLSKQAHFEAMNTTATAPDVAKIFLNTIFRHHGLPQVIVSDRDSKFTSNFWQALFKMLDTRLAMSTSFHPQTDGQTERTNRTLEQILRNYVSYKQDNWDQCLTMAEFAYNNAQQSSTKLSPFFLNHEQHLKTPATLHQSTPVAAVEDFTLQMKNLLQVAQDNIHQAQATQAKYANQHRRAETFEVGDTVLVSSDHINLPSQSQRPTRKFQAHFLGPYKVTEIISETAYKIDLPGTLKIHPVFHVSKLRRYTKSDEENFPERIPAPPLPILVDDHEEFVVEEILAKREKKSGRSTRMEYLVKWQNYPEYDATWEPLTNLGNAQQAIQDFEEHSREN